MVDFWEPRRGGDRSASPDHAVGDLTLTLSATRNLKFFLPQRSACYFCRFRLLQAETSLLSYLLTT